MMRNQSDYPRLARQATTRCDKTVWCDLVIVDQNTESKGCNLQLNRRRRSINQ